MRTGGTPPPPVTVDDPGRPRDARRAPGATSRSAGTTSSASPGRRAPRSRSTCTTSPTRTSWSSRPAGIARLGRPAPAGLLAVERSGHVAAVVLARHVRGDSAAAGLAGVRRAGEEAAAYARWRGARLPTEAEFHRAAFGTPGQPDRTPAALGRRARRRDARQFRLPVVRNRRPSGSYPQGASAWGVHDLVGNGWEWTSTVFGPLPGLRADGLVSRSTRRTSSTASTTS